MNILEGYDKYIIFLMQLLAEVGSLRRSMVTEYTVGQ